MEHVRWVLTFFILIFIMVGCSKLPPIDDGFAASIVQKKIGTQVEWYQGCGPSEEGQKTIQKLLDTELTVDSAIQIALLNNPKIQSIFEEIGIARADLIEAGLLSNPSFSLDVRYPGRRKFHTNIEYLITTNLLDIFLIPLRTKLASTEFEQVKLKLSHEILQLAFDVREVFYELVSERKKVPYLCSIADLEKIYCEIVFKQALVGNVKALDVQLSKTRCFESEVQIIKVEGEIVLLQEKLNRLLGFTKEVHLTLSDDLDEQEYQSFDLCDLEQVAMNERLDIHVARFEIGRLSQMLGLKDWWTYTNCKGGLAGEKDISGVNLIGPGFSGEIPLFNYGQAARMRLYSQLRQAQNRLSEIEIQVRSEVRESYIRLMKYFEIFKEYQTRLLPMHSKILSSSEALYNVMGLGIDKLLKAKHQEVLAYQNYIESMKKYLIARVALDRALEGNLFRVLAHRESIQGGSK